MSLEIRGLFQKESFTPNNLVLVINYRNNKSFLPRPYGLVKLQQEILNSVEFVIFYF